MPLLQEEIMRRILCGMKPNPDNTLETTLTALREATRKTPYENHLYLVGGLIRDRLLGLPLSNDLDIVLEGDAVALAHFLYERGVSKHYPVTYPRFGTAMIHVGNSDSQASLVEFVSARAETYRPESRKPFVERGTLQEDAMRRDFTLNTLMENLHTGDILDLSGRGRADLEAGVLRTPLAPRITFFEDPLRMLRAVRFAARFCFEIEAETWHGIVNEAERLTPPTISNERIRDEFVKIMMLHGEKARRGLELLLESRLLAQFLPEMLPMVGCVQGGWHGYDVWEHTLKALESLPDSDPQEVRLALLWHDIAKPATRTPTEDGRAYRFYGHPTVGAEQVREIMNRLKFSKDEIRDVSRLVQLHMRLGEYRATWTDATVRRLIRDCEPYLERLFLVTECDRSAVDIPLEERADLEGLRRRIAEQNALMNVAKVVSPLDGAEIMQILGIGQGATIREAKDYLTNAVIEGTLGDGDKVEGERRLWEWFEKQ